ncbi:MAG: hypothetical protein SFU99_04965 [Saprospiraceae bacterium]|nr:hypothetical protein [Saprospiraceae bacterium]
MSCKKGFLFLFFLMLLIIACNQDGADEKIPNVSDIEVKTEIRRFDQVLFSLDTNNIEASLAQLEADYPDFSKIYFGQILGSTDSLLAPEGHPTYVKGFIRYPSVRQLYDTTQIIFADFSEIERQFQQAFQFLKYYFPNRPTPDVTTFISEYSVAAFIYGEDQLAVGLDLFLGEHYPYQQYNPGNPNFSEYLVRTFNKEHLVAKTLQPLIDEILGEPTGNRLIDMMIHNGKELYVLDKLLPYTPDSVKLEVSSQQVKWLEDNELEMFAYFLKEKSGSSTQNLLYSTDWQDIRKYVEYSPNSPGMPEEAPGRTANWLGWQIVKVYMKQFPETTMQQLIDLKDAQKLLDDSKYRPKR